MNNLKGLFQYRKDMEEFFFVSGTFGKKELF